MITGPSIGPAMVLTVLMRWPSLIVAAVIGGGATLAYNNRDLLNLDEKSATTVLKDSAMRSPDALNPAAISAATAFVAAPVELELDHDHEVQAAASAVQQPRK